MTFESAAGKTRRDALLVLHVYLLLQKFLSLVLLILPISSVSVLRKGNFSLIYIQLHTHANISIHRHTYTHAHAHTDSGVNAK